MIMIMLMTNVMSCNCCAFGVCHKFFNKRKTEGERERESERERQGESELITLKWAMRFVFVPWPKSKVVLWFLAVIFSGIVQSLQSFHGFMY